MARNSSGVYTLPRTAFVAGVTIFSSAVNADFADIGTCLTTTVATTGVTPITAQTKLFSGTVASPSMTFDGELGTGFYLAAANKIAVVNTSISVCSINASATAVWSYLLVFNASVLFNGQASLTPIVATTTITGDLIVTGGMNVGFSDAPVADRLAIGDENLCLDFDVGTLPILNLDSGDYIGYTRATNILEMVVGGTAFYTQDSTSTKVNGALVIPEISAPTSASANTARIYARDNSGSTYVYYKDEQGVETPMGRPGQWEEIGEYNITTAGDTSEVEFLLSKVYSRLVLIGRGISRTDVASAHFAVSVSDNSGASYEQALYGMTIDQDGDGDAIETRTTTSSGIVSAVISGTFDGDSQTRNNMRCEYSMCDKSTGAKQYQFDCCGWNSTQDAYNGVRGCGQTADCGVINAIRINLSIFLEEMAAGRVTLYGLNV